MCGLWNRRGLLDKYSCRVKWTSRTVEEYASTVISPKEQPRIVRISGMFSRSISSDSFFTPKAWHSSLACNGRSAFDTHIRASIPSLDPPPFCAPMRVRVVSYPSPKCLPLVISFNFSLLAEMVTSPRIASILRETRRNLHTTVGKYRIMNEVGIMDAPTHISEIRSGIILMMSVRKLSDIATRCGSISSFFSKYLLTSCVFGLIGIATQLVKCLVISPPT